MWRLIDISGDGYYFHVKNKNIYIEKDGVRIDTISFADVNSIIVHGKRNTYSEEFLAGCISYSIPFIVCDDKHVPSGILLPWFQHLDSATRLEIQINMKLPKKKQAWQKIVRAKVSNQSRLLALNGKIEESRTLDVMASHTLSGDSSNVEAQAARVYFQSLFGDSFIRQDEEDGVNSLLNYGYTIARSMMARAIVGAGLCPSISVFHSNRINPFALCDDLIEPIRPFVDKKVKELVSPNKTASLSPDVKKELISLLTYPVRILGQDYELSKAIEIYVYSYYKFISCNSKDIVYPEFKGD